MTATKNEKQAKTARELEDMIKARMSVGGVFLKVHKDPAYGWHPTVIAAPSQAVTYQQRAEQIAAELRAIYDLKE